MSPVIHHTFGPLADARQRALATSWLLRPWAWSDTQPVRDLETALGNLFLGEAICFGSGREALLALLRSLRLQPGDEIIVQGYTCIVVPNAIHAAGGVPVYADIEEATLNLDAEDVRKRITPKTKAVICQHTFGIPADTERLRTLCDERHIALIEDCAHVLPDDSGPVGIGARGDAMLLSFGRDKAISGVSGGAVVIRDAALAAAVRDEQRNACGPCVRTTLRYLLYPLLYGLGRPLYGSGIGKAFLALCGKLRLLPPILNASERNGRMPSSVSTIPAPCAVLALDQLKSLRVINDHRRARTRQYLQACKDAGWKPLDGVTPDLPLQKFPLFVNGADSVRAALKAGNIHLDDGWTGCVICPRTASVTGAGYLDGCDPRAETVAASILSLPTHPGTTAADAQRVVDALVPLLPR